MKKILLFAMILTSFQAFAKAKSTVPTAPAVPSSTEEVFGEKSYNEVMKWAKDTPRNLAQVTVDVPAIENKFESDFKQMRTELIGDGKGNKGADTVEKFSALVDRYSDQKNYDGLSDQAKFLALQLRAVRPYKSFIYRAQTYVGKTTATRAMIVSMLRAQISGIQNFFPVNGNASVNHWEVVFKYITEPSSDMAFKIDDDKDFYSFMTYVTNDSQKITEDFRKIVDEKKSIWWDNKLYMSFATFTNEKDRYVYLGLPEQMALLSGAYMNLSALFAATAYSYDGLQDSVKSVGQLFGIDSLQDSISASINGQGADGMSSLTRIKVLNQHKNLFVLVPDGKLRMMNSYSYLKGAAYAANASFEMTKMLPSGQENLFDPRIANGMARLGGVSFSRIIDLVNENGASSTLVNGEKIKVNLKAFFSNPPQKLSELYPTSWTEKPRLVDVKAWGKGDKMKNYKYGMPASWTASTYQAVFPEMQADLGGNRTSQVPKFARILSQTWGTAAFALPMGAIIF